VYITDSTSTLEITSYALPLPFEAVPVDTRQQLQYDEAKRRIEEGTDDITSHSVFIVDKSGSMRKSDVNGHQSRARAVYYTLAEEIILPQLEDDSVSHTDLVTIIEFRDEPVKVLDKEPVSWVLYNKLVELSEKEDARSHGMYMPALEYGFKQFESSHELCALSVFFLSDGRPSDYLVSMTSPDASCQSVYINEKLAKQVAPLGNRLTFWAFGLGTDETEFYTLPQIVEKAKKLGAKGNLIVGKDGASLTTAFASSLASLIQTRTLLTRLNGFTLVGTTGGDIGSKPVQKKKNDAVWDAGSFDRDA
jgi:hypothetical protein